MPWMANVSTRRRLGMSLSELCLNDQACHSTDVPNMLRDFRREP